MAIRRHRSALAARPGPAAHLPTSFACWRRGLIQRARLLDAISADLYGPQWLLHEGLIPPELVFGHPGFLRPCHGIQLAGRRFCTCMPPTWAAAGRHLLRPGRSHTGPPGRVTRWKTASFCRACCRIRFATAGCSGWPCSSVPSAIRSVLAPHNRDNPRIVLLTPGPVQRNLFRARLPGPLSGLHAGRGRRSDGARQPGLSASCWAACSQST